MIEEDRPMNNETKIMLLKQRKAMLEARGSHNNKLIAKINRRIRALEGKE